MHGQVPVLSSNDITSFPRMAILIIEPKNTDKLNGISVSSLVPRPHPLMRRNGLVNQVKFLGLAHALATM